MRRCFEPEQLPECRVHLPVTGFPLLPASQCLVDHGGGGGLGKARSLAGGPDLLRRWDRPLGSELVMRHIGIPNDGERINHETAGPAN